MQSEGDTTVGIALFNSIGMVKPAFDGRLRVELQQPEICPPPEDR